MKTKLLLLVAFSVAASSIFAQSNLRRNDPLQKMADLRKEVRLLQDNRSRADLIRTSRSTREGVVSPVKSGLETKQKLDFMTYDFWNPEINGWTTMFKDEYRYDGLGRNSEVLWHWCEDSVTGCTFEFREVFTFDSKSNVNLVETFWWDLDLNQWIASSKTEYLYDSNDNRVQDLEYYFDDSLAIWNPSWKDEYTYDTQGNMLSRTSSDWDDSLKQWIASSMEECRYDSGGNLVSSTGMWWDFFTEEWIPSNKEELTYDAYGNQILDLSSTWDLVLNQWVPSMKFESTYNENGKQVMARNYYYEPESAQWMLGSWSDLHYDEFGNLSYVEESWEPDTLNPFDPTSRTEYTYDNTYSFSDLVLPEDMFFSGMFTHKMTSILGLDKDDSLNILVPEMRALLLYSDFNYSGIPDKPKPEIRIFPNPVDEILVFDSDVPMDSAVLEITDIRGARVLRRELHGTHHQISVREMSNGIYLYQIIMKGDTRRGKIVVN